MNYQIPEGTKLSTVLDIASKTSSLIDAFFAEYAPSFEGKVTKWMVSLDGRLMCTIWSDRDLDARDNLTTSIETQDFILTDKFPVVGQYLFYWKHCQEDKNNESLFWHLFAQVCTNQVQITDSMAAIKQIKQIEQGLKAITYFIDLFWLFPHFDCEIIKTQSSFLICPFNKKDENCDREEYAEVERFLSFVCTFEHKPKYVYSDYNNPLMKKCADSIEAKFWEKYIKQRIDIDQGDYQY